MFDDKVLEIILDKIEENLFVYYVQRTVPPEKLLSNFLI
jgi:hypothetical protein